MFLIVPFIVSSFVLIHAQYEGEVCEKDGVPGTCINIQSCQSAIDDIKKRIKPKVCTFDNATPIVCCVSNSNQAPLPPPPPRTTEAPRPVATTTRSKTTTTEYTPPVYDYELVDKFVGTGGCEAIPTSMTSPPTGQKAFDKCLEYQEQLVYPCERGVALTGSLSRNNNCFHKADELIVGGVNAAANEFPHMVILGYGPRDSLSWVCGGALISDRYILTAGHCTAGNVDVGPVTHVLVGALRRAEQSDPSKVFKVKRIIKDPNYTSPNQYNDIALLELEKPVELNKFTVPACLHVGDDVDDSRVSTAGWGLTTYKGAWSDVLQKVILNKFSTQECSVKFPVHRHMKQGFDENTQTCYGDRTQSKDTCQGDSGGPLHVKSKKINCMYLIVGVTSAGKRCGFVGDPGLYTRVAPYVSWIESIVWP